MRAPSYTHQFKKDVRRMLKQGKDAVRIKTVMTALVEEDPLAESFRDHVLAGSFKDRRECHLEPDWLLVYKLVGDEIVFERTGTHADLFE
jgi:mRNA interferase YafQ